MPLYFQFFTTPQVIESLNSKTRTYTVWDTQVPALGVRVYTDGRRFYVTHLSIPNKTLAVVGQLTLKKMRQHVQALQACFFRQRDETDTVDSL